jgi:predicted CXXCH cytochrome family protein
VDAVGPALLSPEPALCIDCHRGRAAAAEHRIDVLQREPMAPLLPLREGRLTCITCHDEHVYTGAMLRVSRRDLCSACHRF